MKLATNDRSDKMFLLTSKFRPQGIVSPCPGAIYGNRSFRIRVNSCQSHFVPFWLFRTHFYFQFGHCVPISYPIWSFLTFFYYFLENRFGHFVPFWLFRTHFYFQFGHFVPISYPIWSFLTFFYYFLENRFGHFIPSFILSFYCFVPKSFRTQAISYPLPN